MRSLTLTEFVLDRIAEDEAPTFELVPYGCGPGCCAPAGWVGHRCLICGTLEYGGSVEAITDVAKEHEARIHNRARVLAECEAKRDIIGFVCFDIESGVEQLRPNDVALRAIASLHADHPDYRQEWKL